MTFQVTILTCFSSDTIRGCCSCTEPVMGLWPKLYMFYAYDCDINNNNNKRGNIIFCLLASYDVINRPRLYISLDDDDNYIGHCIKRRKIPQIAKSSVHTIEHLDLAS